MPSGATTTSSAQHHIRPNTSVHAHLRLMTRSSPKSGCGSGPLTRTCRPPGTASPAADPARPAAPHRQKAGYVRPPAREARCGRRTGAVLCGPNDHDERPAGPTRLAGRRAVIKNFPHRSAARPSSPQPGRQSARPYIHTSPPCAECALLPLRARRGQSPRTRRSPRSTSSMRDAGA